MMTTVELFAGIGGFRLAAERQGIKTIWANDICPKACKVYRSAFGENELHAGDIRDHLQDIPAHDLLTAGFPCQPFSSAGKKSGIRDSRGTLFQIIVETLDRFQPRFFVLENVKRLLAMEGGQHFATILSALAELRYRLEWRLLNAADFSLPQNRQRIFIVGEREKSSEKSAAALPIRLATSADVVALTDEQKRLLEDVPAWQPVGQHVAKFPSWGLAFRGRMFAADLERFSPALPPVLLRDVLQPEIPAEFDFTEATLRWLPANTPVNRFIQGVEIISNQAGGARMGYTIFGINGVAPTLTSTTSRHYERYRVGNRYRRLTNVEYARIQGFPDQHCRAVSLYDQYPLYGNAVPPPMASWVMGRLAAPGLSSAQIAQNQRQRSLFGHAQ